MIVDLPENEYEKEILGIIKTHNDFSKCSDGEKSIVYDLCKQVQQTISIPWKNINLIDYVISVFRTYKSSQHIANIKIIANCINMFFTDYEATLENIGLTGLQKIIINHKEVK